MPFNPFVMLKAFKEFAIRGNVVDLAVGFIIGSAFGKIVTSIVDDLVMPLIGIFFKADFSNLFIPLSPKVSEALDQNPLLTLVEAKQLGPVFAWGNFVTVAVNFIILAFIIFMMVKAINSLRRKQEKGIEPIEPSADVKLLTEIRDLLKTRQ